MCEDCNPNWTPPTLAERAEVAPEDSRQSLAPAVPQAELTALGRSLGHAANGRLCARCGLGEIVEGGYCVRCAEWAFGEAS